MSTELKTAVENKTGHAATAKKTLRGGAAALGVRKNIRKNPNPKHFSETIHGRKKRRFRNGTRALIDIRRYQKTTDTLLCKTHMERIIRSVIAEKSISNLKIEKDALHLLQQETERMLQQFFLLLNFTSLGPEYELKVDKKTKTKTLRHRKTNRRSPLSCLSPSRLKRSRGPFGVHNRFVIDGRVYRSKRRNLGPPSHTTSGSGSGSGGAGGSSGASQHRASSSTPLYLDELLQI